MQNAIPIPHSLSEAVWLALAIILASLFGGGSFAAVWNLILNRRKPAAEINESEARTQKTLAEVRSLELQTNISASDAVLRMVQQLTFAQIANEKLHDENQRLENENQVYERQLQWAKGIFKMKGIRWEDQ